MKYLEKAHLLHFVYEFEDGHEDVILLGVFSSKKKAINAIKKLNNEFKSELFNKRFVIDENRINKLSWEDGFVTID